MSAHPDSDAFSFGLFTLYLTLAVLLTIRIRRYSSDIFLTFIFAVLPTACLPLGFADNAVKVSQANHPDLASLHIFGPDGQPHIEDINQGAIPDCWLEASSE
jgi:hypothetical protein